MSERLTDAELDEVHRLHKLSVGASFSDSPLPLTVLLIDSIPKILAEIRTLRAEVKALTAERDEARDAARWLHNKLSKVAFADLPEGVDLMYGVNGVQYDWMKVTAQ